MRNQSRFKESERSFTLLETIIALAIMVTMILEVINAQGNIAYFSSYTEKLNQGIWMAKRIMAQVEYQLSYREFKELNVKLKDQKLRDEKSDTEFSYDLEIKEWELPIVELIANGGISPESKGKDKDKDSESRSAKKDDSSSVIKDTLKQVLGDEILKLAYVEVFWPEGAKRNSVTLTYLMANQRQLDKKLKELKPAVIQLSKQQECDKKPGWKWDGSCKQAK
ncbi:MAG: hypothetical protein HQK54_08975 [Oligoflexales bacterium]|nr:hypothetical protein [Oligoflexales bacterium]